MKVVSYPLHVSTNCQKGIKRGSVTPTLGSKFASFCPHSTRMSKRFQMGGFRGSTLKKSHSDIFRFGYGKAANDKRVPDRVGSVVITDSLGANRTKMRKTMIHQNSDGQMKRAGAAQE